MPRPIECLPNRGRRSRFQMQGLEHYYRQAHARPPHPDSPHPHQPSLSSIGHHTHKPTVTPRNYIANSRNKCIDSNRNVERQHAGTRRKRSIFRVCFIPNSSTNISQFPRIIRIATPIRCIKSTISHLSIHRQPSIRDTPKPTIPRYNGTNVISPRSRSRVPP